MATSEENLSQHLDLRRHVVITVKAIWNVVPIIASIMSIWNSSLVMGLRLKSCPESSCIFSTNAPHTLIDVNRLTMMLTVIMVYWVFVSIYLVEHRFCKPCDLITKFNFLIPVVYSNKYNLIILLPFTQINSK